MKNKKIVILLLIALFFPLLVFGVESGDDIIKMIENVTGFVWLLFGLGATLSFLYAGFLYLTAQGDATKIATAGKAVMYGLAGIAVAIIGLGIVSIMGSLMGVEESFLRAIFLG